MTIRHKLLSAAFALSILPFAGGCDSHTAMPSHDMASTQSPMEQLIAGNARYAAGHATHPNQDADRRTELAAGQHPIAVIVSCSDSRVPPELVFDQGLGDLFVVRTAGEVVDDQAIGSIEYAVEHLHAHLVVVLGHEKCGAVQATVEGGEAPGHIGSIVKAIQPAVDKAKSEPGDLLQNAVNENVLQIVTKLKTSDPILSHDVGTGTLKIVGARYDLAPGTVEWLGSQQ